MDRLEKFKNYNRLSVFFSSICLLFFIAFIAGSSSCSQFHPVQNEGPALARRGVQNLALSTPLPAAWKRIKKVVLIIFENSDAASTLRQPHFSLLAKKGAYLTSFHAITHPSQPNYIALISGSTQGVTSDANVDLPLQHIGDLLEQNKKTWRAYGEDYPGNCFLGKSVHNYARKHMPFLSFENVQSDPRRCKQVVPADSFASDLTHSNLASFSLYIPNQFNDGHDTGVGYADHWLGEKMLPLLEAKASNSDPDNGNNTLFIVTFDEGVLSGDNKVYTALFGAGVRVGAVSNQVYSHFSLLRTIEMILGVPSLGLNDAEANYIDDVWE